VHRRSLDTELFWSGTEAFRHWRQRRISSLVNLCNVGSVGHLQTFVTLCNVKSLAAETYTVGSRSLRDTKLKPNSFLVWRDHLSSKELCEGPAMKKFVNSKAPHW